MPGVTSSSYCPLLFAHIKENRKKSAKSRLTTNIMYIIPILQIKEWNSFRNMTMVKLKHELCQFFKIVQKHHIFSWVTGNIELKKLRKAQIGI